MFCRNNLLPPEVVVSNYSPKMCFTMFRLVILQLLYPLLHFRFFLETERESLPAQHQLITLSKIWLIG